ncbi:hypothetical protein C8R43DRAFT_943199 [Mycena crocata]|nr:hypothetical protein C8R43DRAFT_943199 [Mycena crocata]
MRSTITKPPRKTQQTSTSKRNKPLEQKRSLDVVRTAPSTSPISLLTTAESHPAPPASKITPLSYSQPASSLALSSQPESLSSRDPDKTSLSITAVSGVNSKTIAPDSALAESRAPSQPSILSPAHPPKRLTWGTNLKRASTPSSLIKPPKLQETKGANLQLQSRLTEMDAHVEKLKADLVTLRKLSGEWEDKCDAWEDRAHRVLRESTDTKKQLAQAQEVSVIHVVLPLCRILTVPFFFKQKIAELEEDIQRLLWQVGMLCLKTAVVVNVPTKADCDQNTISNRNSDLRDAEEAIEGLYKEASCLPQTTHHADKTRLRTWPLSPTTQELNPDTQMREVSRTPLEDPYVLGGNGMPTASFSALSPTAQGTNIDTQMADVSGTPVENPYVPGASVMSMASYAKSEDGSLPTIARKEEAIKKAQPVDVEEPNVSFNCEGIYGRSQSLLQSFTAADAVHVDTEIAISPGLAASPPLESTSQATKTTGAADDPLSAARANEDDAVRAHAGLTEEPLPTSISQGHAAAGAISPTLTGFQPTQQRTSFPAAVGVPFEGKQNTHTTAHPHEVDISDKAEFRRRLLGDLPDPLNLSSGSGLETGTALSFDPAGAAQAQQMVEPLLLGDLHNSGNVKRDDVRAPAHNPPFQFGPGTFTFSHSAMKAAPLSLPNFTPGSFNFAAPDGSSMQLRQPPPRRPARQLPRPKGASSARTSGTNSIREYQT